VNRKANSSSESTRIIAEVLEDAGDKHQEARARLWQEVIDYVMQLERLPIEPMADDKEARRDVSVAVLRKLESNDYALLRDWMSRDRTGQGASSWRSVLNAVTMAAATDWARASQQNTARPRVPWGWAVVEPMSPRKMNTLIDATMELSVRISELTGFGERQLVHEAREFAATIARARGLMRDDYEALLSAADMFGAPFADDSSRPRRSPSPGLREEIVEALLRLPGMDEKSARSMLIPIEHASLSRDNGKRTDCELILDQLAKLGLRHVCDLLENGAHRVKGSDLEPKLRELRVRVVRTIASSSPSPSPSPYDAPRGADWDEMLIPHAKSKGPEIEEEPWWRRVPRYYGGTVYRTVRARTGLVAAATVLALAIGGLLYSSNRRAAIAERPCERTIRGNAQDITDDTTISSDIVCLDSASLHIRGSHDLIIKATTVRILMASSIAGEGSPGPTGPPGSNAFQGNQESCHQSNLMPDAEGHASWCTEVIEHWNAANDGCRRSPPSDPCEIGGDGGTGEVGATGPSVIFDVLEPPKLSGLEVHLAGGPGGPGGVAGRGARHYLLSVCPDDYRELRPQSDPRQQTFDCPSGKPGRSGPIGPPGRCVVRIAGQERLCDEFK
jgi:hypothetical protein